MSVFYCACRDDLHKIETYRNLLGYKPNVVFWWLTKKVSICLILLSITTICLIFDVSPFVFNILVFLSILIVSSPIAATFIDALSLSDYSKVFVEFYFIIFFSVVIYTISTTANDITHYLLFFLAAFTSSISGFSVIYALLRFAILYSISSWITLSDALLFMPIYCIPAILILNIFVEYRCYKKLEYTKKLWNDLN